MTHNTSYTTETFLVDVHGAVVCNCKTSILSLNFSTPPTGGNVTDEYEHQNVPNRFLPVVVYISIIMVMGIIGNGHVLLVFYGNYKRNSTYRTFVLFLAWIDLLICGVCLPFEIVNFLFVIIIPIGMCKFMFHVTASLALSSIFILVVIAVERYRRVTKPLNPKLTNTFAKRLCVAAIVVSGVFQLPKIWMTATIRVFVNDKSVSALCFTAPNQVGSTLDIVRCVLISGICFGSIIILSFVYLSIHRTIERRDTNVVTRQCELYRRVGPDRNTNTEFPLCTISSGTSNTRVTTSNSNSVTRHNKGIVHHFVKRNRKYPSRYFGYSSSKSTRIMFLVTVTFVLSYLPTLTLDILGAAFPHLHRQRYDDITIVFLYLIWLSFGINCVSNPFIYCFYDKKFRMEIVKRYRCKYF